MKLRKVINGAVGAFEQYCAGYLNPGASGPGYIATIKLSVGRVKIEPNKCLEQILCYDRAEENDAYVGQINMIDASSFCGINGAIWGYDLARANNFNNGELSALLEQKRHDGAKIPVWDIRPLLDTTEHLFGTKEQKRFPILPGATVICPGKYEKQRGPATVWCSIVLAVAEDRENDANLFMHFTGKKNGKQYPSNFYEKIAHSIATRGKEQDILFKEIFVGLKELSVAENEIGCALSCTPFITLAQNAIPEGIQPADLRGMTISQWESALQLPPFKPRKVTD